MSASLPLVDYEISSQQTMTVSLTPLHAQQNNLNTNYIFIKRVSSTLVQFLFQLSVTHALYKIVIIIPYFSKFVQYLFRSIQFSLLQTRERWFYTTYFSLVCKTAAKPSEPFYRIIVRFILLYYYGTCIGLGIELQYI